MSINSSSKMDLSLITKIAEAMKKNDVTSNSLQYWSSSIKNLSLQAFVNMPMATEDVSKVEELQESIQASIQATQFIESLQIAIESCE